MSNLNLVFAKDDGTKIDVTVPVDEWRRWDVVVRLDGVLYFRESPYVYHEARVTDVKLPKAPKARPAEIERAYIWTIARKAKDAGFAVKYRNRNGKQYMTLSYTAESLKNGNYQYGFGQFERPAHRFIDQYFPDAVHTSGGGYSRATGGEHTWRLNP